MPLLLDTPQTPGRAAQAGAATVEIALLNNLGDAGLRGGERQFVEILSAVAGPDPVRLRIFSLPGIARGPEAQARIAASYTPFAILMRSRIDGLIVTGCEPVATHLQQEPLWPLLTEVIDWAEHNTLSTILSCLAAHAAVLHLDGIDRRPLERKCSGLFTVERVGLHPLLDGLNVPLVVPHSRWNGLDEAALAASGYEILTRSKEVGVDLFVKRWRSLFVYLQGHPEYDESALRGEYRRDVLRYLGGLSSTYPDLPRHYFSVETEDALREFERGVQCNPTTHPVFSLATRPRPRQRRPELALGLFRNWMAHLRADRSANARSSPDAGLRRKVP